jgi:tetratricopeptide (TPR) repeat protein
MMLRFACHSKAPLAHMLNDDPALYEEVRALPQLPAAQAVAVLEQRLARFQQQGRVPERVMTRAALVRELHLAGRHADALACAKLALAEARDLGLRHAEAVALNALGTVQAMQGDLGGAVDSVGQGLALSRELNWPIQVAAACMGLSLVFVHTDLFERAVAALDEARVTLADRDPMRGDRCVSNLIGTLAWWAQRDRDAGEPETVWRPRAQRAERLARHYLDIPEEEARLRGRPPGLMRGNFATALVVLDKLDEAEPLLDELHALHARAGMTEFMLWVDVARAHARLQRGDGAGAEAVLRPAIAASEPFPFAVRRDDLWRMLARALALQGDAAGAADAQICGEALAGALEAVRRTARAQALAIAL